jgi:hypothetical protein
MKSLLLVLFFFPSSLFAQEVTAPVLAPAAFPVGASSIASNGRTFLTFFAMNGQTFASFSGVDGRPLNARPALVPGAPVVPLVWTGSEYAGIVINNGAVHFYRFAEDGRLLASTILPTSMIHGKLASNGHNLLLVGMDAVTRGCVGHVLTPTGAIVRDTGQIGLYQVTSYEITANDDGNFILATATNFSGMRVYRITPAASVDEIYVDPAAPQRVISIAARRESMVVSWTTDSNQNFLDVIAGGALARRESALAFVIRTASGYAVETSLAEVGGVQLETLDAAGNPTGSGVTIPVATLGSIAAAGDLVEILGGTTVTWVRLYATPRVPFSAVIAMFPKRQIRPAAASDGTGFLAAFHESTATSDVVTAARFARGAAPIDGAGFKTGNAGARTAPAVAFGGDRYLVISDDGTDLSGTFVDTAGNADTPFLIRKNATMPALVWNDSDFFAVWVEKQRIWGATISPAGVVGTPQQISPDPPPLPNSDQLYHDPDLTWDGNRYVVAWLLSLAPPAGTNCVMGCESIVTALLVEHVEADGTPVETTALPPYNTPQLGITGAHVASSGPGNALLVIDHGYRIDTAIVRNSAVEFPHVFFEWLVTPFPSVASDVIADSGAYVIAWRFVDASRSFISTARIPSSGNGTAFSTRSTVAGLAVPYDAQLQPALVTNFRDEVAVVTSDVVSLGEPGRVYAHFTADMPATPIPPAAPQNVTADVRDGALEVTWSAVDGAEGFIVEITGTRPDAPLALAPAGATHASIPTDIHHPIEVRAYNAGGLGAASAAVTPIVHPQPHRRAARH